MLQAPPEGQAMLQWHNWTTEAGGQEPEVPQCPSDQGATLPPPSLPRGCPVAAACAPGVCHHGQTAGRSQAFTTSENRHQPRNSGTTCLPFEVWLLVFTVLFLKCIKDV